tara:strand:+ start:809 stop:1237 length:429 start_codon:yes stop_codon:yes gene_type:complete
MGSDPFNHYTVGVNNVGSYQVAGVPWITGSSALGKGHEVRFEFPKITKNITVINQSVHDIRVHFNTTASTNVVNGLHYLLFNSKEDSYTFNVKADSIYVSCVDDSVHGSASFTVIAELTQIPVPMNWAGTITGSGLTTLDGS